MIGTEYGVVRAWTAKRMVEEERWSAKAIQNIKATPAQENPQMPGISILIAVNIERATAEGEPKEVERRK